MIKDNDLFTHYNIDAHFNNNGQNNDHNNNKNNNQSKSIKKYSQIDRK